MFIYEIVAVKFNYGYNILFEFSSEEWCEDLKARIVLSIRVFLV